MGRRWFYLVVAGSLAAAGCFPSPPPPPPPPPPTQVCGQGFGSASQYQTSFYNLGQVGTGWVTADGFVAASLPDGRVTWWMSDTMTGAANPENSVSNPGNVHNSTVEQGGGCLTPHLGVIPQSGAAYYWPGSATVVGNAIEVFSYKVVPATGSPGFDWQIVGTSVTRFSLPSLQLVSGPTDMPVNQPPYQSNPSVIPWGIRSFYNGADGKVYLYGTTKHSDFPVAADTWVARAPVDNPQALEYFTNPVLPTDPAWSSNFADAKQMSFTKNQLPDSAPASQLSVVPYGNGFLAGAFAADVLQDTNGRSFVRAWTSQSPQGPWTMLLNGTQPRDVATFQARTPDQFAYDARIANLPGGGWTVVYSVNDPINSSQDFTLYRGEFATPSGLPAP